MKTIDNKEMIVIKGGASLFSGTMLSAIIKGIDTLFQMGRSFGTAIRMFFSKRKC